MCFLVHASLCLPWLSLREPETSDALGGRGGHSVTQCPQKSVPQSLAQVVVSSLPCFPSSSSLGAPGCSSSLPPPPIPVALLLILTYNYR